MVLLNPPAVVHVDLDGAREIFEAHGWSYPRPDDPLFTSGLAATLDVLEQAGIRATLFVIARVLDDPRSRSMLQDAVRRGHAIGSHTITHRWLPALPRHEQRREIAESRSRLSETLGVPVDGFRAPGFGTDAAILDMVGEAGYRYDSSLFGASLDTAPYVLPSGLVELPLPRHKPMPWPFHPSYSLVLGAWYFRAGLARFRRRGAPLIVLVHLTDLAEPLAASELTGWSSRLFSLSHLSAATKRRRLGAMLSRVALRYRWAESEDLLSVRPSHTAARRDGIA